MDTFLKIIEPLLAQIEALLLLAVVFLILHFAIKHRFKKKKLKIAELKKKIRSGLGWEGAGLEKLKRYGAEAFDATALTVGTTGMSLLDAYLASGGTLIPGAEAGTILDAGSAALDTAGTAVDAAGTAVDAASAVGDTAGVAADTVSGIDVAGSAADSGLLDTIAAKTDAFDVTQHVPAVSAGIFGLRTLRNVLRLSKNKQTGREAGINIGMDFLRIGTAGAGAVGLGKLGAAAGTAVAPGLGTVVGGGVGIFAGSLFGSKLVNNARHTMKWGKIEKAQEYFGGKYVEGEISEFAPNFADEFFKTAELRERLENEKKLVEGYSAELDPYSDKEVSVEAVLSDESVTYLETVLAKAEYVKEHLDETIRSTCEALAKTTGASSAGIRAANLAGELVLQAPECIDLTPQEKLLVREYNAQRAVSKDYPCRFDADGSAVLETLSMELFNKYNPAIGRPEKTRRPIWLILFAVTAAVLACTVGYCYF